MQAMTNFRMWLTIAVIAMIGSAQAEVPGKTVFTCTFEGPYYRGGGNDEIQKGCRNNYEWGKKEMTVKIDRPADGHGASQLFDIRSISSGAMQYFVTGFAIRRGYYYTVSFRAKGEMDGSASVQVRKIAKPWNTYISGLSFTPEKAWRTYSFTGKAPTDVDGDIAVTFGSGTPGQLWIDDIRIEEFQEAPDSVNINRNPLVKGNLLPRSSFEGKVDYLWTSGIYAGADGEWEDPQVYRAEGGYCGQYAMAIPAATTEGTVFCRSFWVPVAAGSPYTFSIYLKGSRPKAVVDVQINARQGGGRLGGGRLTLSDHWQRYSFTSMPIPADVSDVYISFTAPARNGTVFADAAQLEAGSAATDFKPAFPYELYADTAGFRSNISTWGEPLKVNLRAAAAIKNGSRKTLPVRLSVMAFPAHQVMERTLELPLGSEFPLEIDTALNGLFRVRLTPLDPALAAPQEILLARLPPPRSTGRDSSFGTHITVRPFFIDYARRIGMKWTRFHDSTIITKWKGAEPKPGDYRFYDKQVDAVIAAGINILGLPDYPPEWAKKNNAANVIDLDAYRNLCRRLAEHYKGRIDYWEVWNEPYIKYFYSGTPKQYGQVLAVGADAFRAGNSAAQVLGFCTEINDIGYAEQIPAADRQKIDILSFHCYFQNLTGGGKGGFRQEVDAYLDFLKPVKPREIWNTEGANRELGANSFYSFMPAIPENLNEQAAAFGARVWVEQRKGGIDKLFLYTLHQSDTITYYGGYKKLIGFDRSVTPAAAATATAAWCIDGLKCLPLKQRHGIVQGLFADGKRSCWVVFDDNSVTGRCMFNTDKLPAGTRVIDVMGNPPTKSQLEIGIMPYFVLSENIAPEMLAEQCGKAIE